MPTFPIQRFPMRALLAGARRKEQALLDLTRGWWRPSRLQM